MDTDKYMTDGVIMKKVFIIGIVLLILIGVIIIGPNITTAKLSSCEASAFAGLKMAVAQEKVWQQQDPDGNGIKDFWTYDISCFNRIYRPDGITKIGFFDVSFARADGAPATDNVFSGHPAIEPWIGDTIDKSDFVTLTSKSGYWFRAMLIDENGVPYNQNPVGANSVKACNSAKYAFVAYPDAVGISGIYIHIVNEAGQIYSTMVTGESHKVILQWPGKDPAKSYGPSGYRWLAEDEYYKALELCSLTVSWSSFIPLVFPIIIGVLAIILSGKRYKPDAETSKRNKRFLTTFLVSIIPVFIIMVYLLGYSQRWYGLTHIKFLNGLDEISDLYRQAVRAGEELPVLEGFSFLVLSCSLLISSITVFIRRRSLLAFFPIVLVIISLLTSLSGALKEYWYPHYVLNIVSAGVWFIVYSGLLWLFLRLVNKSKPLINTDTL